MTIRSYYYYFCGSDNNNNNTHSQNKRDGVEKWHIHIKQNVGSVI